MPTRYLLPLQLVGRSGCRAIAAAVDRRWRSASLGRASISELCGQESRRGQFRWVVSQVETIELSAVAITPTDPAGIGTTRASFAPFRQRIPRLLVKKRPAEMFHVKRPTEATRRYEDCPRAPTKAEAVLQQSANGLLHVAGKYRMSSGAICASKQFRDASISTLLWGALPAAIPSQAPYYAEGRAFRGEEALSFVRAKRCRYQPSICASVSAGLRSQKEPVSMHCPNGKGPTLMDEALDGTLSTQYQDSERP